MIDTMSPHQCFITITATVSSHSGVNNVNMVTITTSDICRMPSLQSAEQFSHEEEDTTKYSQRHLLYLQFWSTISPHMVKLPTWTNESPQYHTLAQDSLNQNKQLQTQRSRRVPSMSFTEIQIHSWFKCTQALQLIVQVANYAQEGQQWLPPALLLWFGRRSCYVNLPASASRIPKLQAHTIILGSNAVLKRKSGYFIKPQIEIATRENQITEKFHICVIHINIISKNFSEKRNSIALHSCLSSDNCLIVKSVYI